MKDEAAISRPSTRQKYPTIEEEKKDITGPGNQVFKVESAHFTLKEQEEHTRLPRTHESSHKEAYRRSATHRENSSKRLDGNQRSSSKRIAETAEAVEGGKETYKENRRKSMKSSQKRSSSRRENFSKRLEGNQRSSSKRIAESTEPNASDEAEQIRPKDNRRRYMSITEKSSKQVTHSNRQSSTRHLSRTTGEVQNGHINDDKQQYSESSRRRHSHKEYYRKRPSLSKRESSKRMAHKDDENVTAVATTQEGLGESESRSRRPRESSRNLVLREEEDTFIDPPNGASMSSPRRTNHRRESSRHLPHSQQRSSSHRIDREEVSIPGPIIRQQEEEEKQTMSDENRNRGERNSQVLTSSHRALRNDFAASQERSSMRSMQSSSVWHREMPLPYPEENPPSSGMAPPILQGKAGTEGLPMQVANQFPVQDEENTRRRKSAKKEKRKKRRVREGRNRCFYVIACILVAIIIAVGVWQWLTVLKEKEDESNATAATQIAIPATIAPMQPSKQPTDSPSIFSGQPTLNPSFKPSGSPTMVPSNIPTQSPTTQFPSSAPSEISKRVYDIVLANAKFGGSEFLDTGTYQSKALNWLMSESADIYERQSGLGVEELVLQLYALSCLFYATNEVPNTITDVLDITVSQWSISGGWLESVSSGGCDWSGIICDVNGRVEKLSLPEYGLTGSIPHEMVMLEQSLTYLDLFNNAVYNSGDSGNKFLGQLTSLEYLYLGGTYFEYNGIPSGIGQLTRLVELDISYVSWFGPLGPSPWSQLTNLEYLVLNGNVFNTTLPPELLKLPKLEYLYAVESFLKGDLNFVSAMPNIRELWVDGNPFGSSVPTSLPQSLGSFSASNCGLIGAVPPSLGELSGLTHLWLNDNKLSQTIPTQLGSLSKLQTLSLTGNNLSGSMPSEVCIKRNAFVGKLTVAEVDTASVGCSSDCCTCCGTD